MIDFKRALELWKQRGKPGLTEEEREGIFKMTVASKLSQLSKTWKKVQPVQPSFSNVEDGDYVGDLKQMLLAEAKKSGRLQVESTYEIADGDYEGKTVKRFDGLDDEIGMGYFKGYCEVIGLELSEDLELLQEAMDEFVANNTDLFNITVKTKDKYANVYVNGVSEFVKSTEEGEEQEVEEVEEVEEAEEVEEVEEAEEVEEVEEVEEQEVTPPAKKQITKPVTKTVTKIVTKPVVTSPTIKKIGVIKKK